MDIIQITQTLSKHGLRSRKYDDLWTDRLCYYWSVLILVIFACLITSKAYVGDPIDCWAPPEFKSSYEKYAETLCFVNGTYHISATEPDIPIDYERRYSNRIRYYQWTPFILLFQAFLMYAPRIFWISFNKHNGLNIYSLVDAAVKYESLDSYSDKEKILVYICKNLLRPLDAYDRRKRKNFVSDESYRNSRAEISKLLNMQPETSAENSRNYNENLAKLLTRSRSKNKIVMVNLKNDLIGDDEHLMPHYQSTPHEDSKLFENPSTTKNSTKKRSKSPNKSQNKSDHQVNSKKQRNSSVLKSSHKSLRPSLINDSKSVSSEKSSIIKNPDQSGHTINSDHFDQSQQHLNHIQSKLARIANKHILTILSADYVLSTKQVTDMKSSISKANLDYSGKRKNKKIQAFILDLSKNFLSLLYVIVKLLYLTSLIGQFYFLNRLIGNEFYLLGINLIKSFLFEYEWPHLTVFPRVTLCEIYIREIGTIHPYVIQCVLRINLFNEVIFVLVWFWLVFLIAVTVCDGIFRVGCFMSACTKCHRKKFALRYLEQIHTNVSQLKQNNIFNQVIADEISSILKNSYIKEESTKNGNLSNEESIMYEQDDRYVNSKLEQNYTSSIYYDNNFSSNLIMLDANPNANICNYSDTYKNIPLSVSKHDNTKEVNVLVKISQTEELQIFEKFCENSFSNDTIFALCIIQQNSSNIIVSEIIEYLWLQFKSLNFIVSYGGEDFILKKLVILEDELEADKPKKHAKKRSSSGNRYGQLSLDMNVRK